MKYLMVTLALVWHVGWRMLPAQPVSDREVDRLKGQSNWFIREGLPMEGYVFDDPGINTQLSMARHWRRQEVRRKNWAWVAVATGAVISGAAVLSCESGMDGSGCEVGGRGIPFVLGLGAGITLRVMAGVSGFKKDASLENAHELLLR